MSKALANGIGGRIPLVLVVIYQLYKRRCLNGVGGFMAMVLKVVSIGVKGHVPLTLEVASHWPYSIGNVT